MAKIGRTGLRALAAAALVAIAGATGAQAATLIGYFGGNDPFGAGQGGGLRGSYNGVAIDATSLAKCDVTGALGCNWSNGTVAGQNYRPAFTIGFTDSRAGTWSFAGNPALTHAPGYMAVKAATTWALYSLDGDASGGWSTLGILNNGGRQPGVSHLSFYGSAAPQPVPLPAAAWLLIAGVGGLGFAARRRPAAAAA